MKIIYLHQYFNTPLMSGGTRSYEMSRRLVKNGHEVHMITAWCSNKNQLKKIFTTLEDGVVVHWIPVHYSNYMSYKRRILSFLIFAVLSARKAASIKADIIFATSTPLTIALPGIYVSRKQKIPMIFEVRDLWPELPIALGALKNPLLKILAYWLERTAYKNSNFIVALSSGMKEGIMKSGYPESKISVIPNCCDIELFNVPSTEGHRFRLSRPWLGYRPLVVYVGAFGVLNGVGYAVELAKHLLKIDPEIKILLIGDGKEVELVTNMAKEKNVLGVNLFIEEKIPKKNVPSVLNAATLSLGMFLDKPEMQVNSSNKFFDSLAAGKPIMINYGGWQKSLLESSDAGFSTWQMDIDSSANLLIKKIRDNNWLAEAGNSARRMAKQLFSRDKLAGKLEEVFFTAVKDTGN